MFSSFTSYQNNYKHTCETGNANEQKGKKAVQEY